MNTLNNVKIEAIDLFCGIGGLTYGLRQANIDVLAGLDNDKSCEYSYQQNNKNKFILADVTKFNFDELNYLYSKNSIKVLVGCAPCQPFSTHAHKVKNKKNSAQWNMINYFIDAVKVLKPHIISMENVRGITKTDVFSNFKAEIKKLGYLIDYKVVYCPDYGVPQNRSRLVFLGSKLGTICVPKETHKRGKQLTVRDVIGSLPKINAGETCQTDLLHKSKNLSPLNLKRIRQSNPNGSWKNWDYSLLPECYKKESGQTYRSVYGRMSWDEVSPTITTQFSSYGSGRFGHPTQDRALSIREGALLQTFPNNYEVETDLSIKTICKHIGNAVPPKLGYMIGKSIIKHIVDNYEHTKQ